MSSTSGIRAPVGWPLVLIAIYVVVVGVGVPVATNIFPESLIGRLFLALPGIWRGIAWGFLVLIVPFLLGRLFDTLGFKPPSVAEEKDD